MCRQYALSSPTIRRGREALGSGADIARGAVPAAYNWTGFYIGAGGGYGMFNLDFSLTQSGALRSDNQALGGRGWFGTGFDYQFAVRRRIRGLGFLRHSRQLARSLLGSGPIKQKWAWFTTQKNRIPRDRDNSEWRACRRHRWPILDWQVIVGDSLLLLFRHSFCRCS